MNLLHPLDSVLVIAIMAVLAGADGPTAIAKWANIKSEFLLRIGAEIYVAFRSAKVASFRGAKGDTY